MLREVHETVGSSCSRVLHSCQGQTSGPTGTHCAKPAKHGEPWRLPLRPVFTPEQVGNSAKVLPPCASQQALQHRVGAIAKQAASAWWEELP